MKHLLLTILFVFLSTNTLRAQAANYFPSSPGYRWEYSMAAIQHSIPVAQWSRVDSFIGTGMFGGKLAYVLTTRSIDSLESFDTTRYAFEGGTAFQYFGTAPPPFDLALNVPPPGWLPVFQFGPAGTSPWLIFRFDTLVSVGGAPVLARIQAQGSRVSLGTPVTVPAGTLNAAMFLTTAQVGTMFGALFIPIFTVVDTAWVVENRWIVRRSSSESNFTFDTFSIDVPGMRQELLNSGEVTSVAGRELGPPGYRLEQNHPNPFNPFTTISYTIPEASVVTLTVYDALGREVARLVDGMRPAGESTVQWDATNVPTGVYYYKLVARNFSHLRAMLVLR